jgi:clan AA aspartic protease (TIGR02281 family)
MKKPILLFVFLSVQMIVLGQGYFLKGLDAVEQEDYDEAISFFGKEIDQNPLSHEAFFWRSYLYFYYKEDKNREALYDISQSIELVGKKEKEIKAKYILHRAEVYSYMKMTDNALSDYNASIKLDSKNKRGYLQRGRFYLKEEKPDLALNDFEKAKTIDPGNEEAQIGIGRVYYETNFSKKAEAVFGEVIRLNSESYSAYYYRSLNYIKQENYEEAIKDMYDCFLNNREYYSSFLWAAGFNYPFSIAFVSEKINEQPSIQSLYIIRSSLYERNYQYRDAIDDYNTLLEMVDEEDINSYLFHKGTCYYHLGAYDYAIQTFNNILKTDSSLIYPYGWRAISKILKYDYKGAEKDLSFAIQKEPGTSWYYSYRADIRAFHLNERKGALNDYNMAYSFDKSNYEFLLKRGRFYKDSIGQKEKAEIDFKKILAADTSDVQDWILALAFIHTGKPELAEEILVKAESKELVPILSIEFARVALLLGKKPKALSLIEKGFEKGFYQFEILEQDPDFQILRNDQEFQKILKKWKAEREQIISSITESEANEIDTTLKIASISMKSRGAGTYEVPCKINGLLLNMIFDTGASDISISQTEVQFMLKNGYLNSSDFTGSQKYMDANGNITVGSTIVFRSVDFGGVILKNVKATVVNNKNAPLLFGQSALSKYGKIVIDNDNKIITIEIK